MSKTSPLKAVAFAVTAMMLPGAALAGSFDTDCLSPLEIAAIKAAYLEPADATPEVDRLTAIELFRLTEAVRVYEHPTLVRLPKTLSDSR